MKETIVSLWWVWLAALMIGSTFIVGAFFLAVDKTDEELKQIKQTRGNALFSALIWVVTIFSCFLLSLALAFNA